MLSWKKLGNVFDPSRVRPHPWMQEYTQCPFPLAIDDKTVRLYFACRPQRDAAGLSLSVAAYVDLDRQDLTRVTGVAEQPLFPLGGPGTFDQFGTTPSSVVEREDGLYVYYTGWTRMCSVPYTMAIGVARSRDGGRTFEKLGAGPILGPTLNEPYLQSGPIVHRIGERWHMWYLCGREWICDQGKFEPVYQIAHAQSDDGIQWQRDGRFILPTLCENECQVSFGLFFREGLWHVIFAHRKPTGYRATSERAYRLGYAWSSDLENWTRDDSQVGIDVSETGWDSQMMCYPQVGNIDGRLYLFYCGNDFGRGGFGIAELVGYTSPV